MARTVPALQTIHRDAHCFVAVLGNVALNCWTQPANRERLQAMSRSLDLVLEHDDPVALLTVVNLAGIKGLAPQDGIAMLKNDTAEGFQRLVGRKAAVGIAVELAGMTGRTVRTLMSAAVKLSRPPFAVSVTGRRGEAVAFVTSHVGDGDGLRGALSDAIDGAFTRLEV